MKKKFYLRMEAFALATREVSEEHEQTYFITIAFFFFFQAEDGIRDHCVTGVQTCALPICMWYPRAARRRYRRAWYLRTARRRYRLCRRARRRAFRPRIRRMASHILCRDEIGRASWRERV